ncbi:MAG: sulfotransferase [Pseudomonadota bacterium]
MVTRLLLIGYQRSGSTAVKTICTRHPQVAYFGGDLQINPFFTRGFASFTIGYQSKAASERGIRALFDTICGLEANEETRCLCAKVVCNSPESAKKLAESITKNIPEMKIILVRRHDLVAQYGSRSKARLTGVAHSWDTKYVSSEPSTTVSINKHLLARFVHVVEQTYAELDKLRENHDVLDVSYEEFDKDNAGTRREIEQFIGLDEVPLGEMHSTKVSPAPEDYIRQYKQLKEFADSERQRVADGTVKPWYAQAVRVLTKLEGMLHKSRGVRRQKIRRDLREKHLQNR